jgi:hypothetical protein
MSVRKLKNNLKGLSKKHTSLFLIALLIFRPKRFWTDILIVAFEASNSFFKMKSLVSQINLDELQQSKHERVLCFATAFIELHWVQLWVFLGKVLVRKSPKTRLFAVTTTENFAVNLLMRLAGFQLIFMNDLHEEKEFFDKPPKANLESWKNFEVSKVPFGKMALSTYCRTRVTGTVNFDDPKTTDDLLRILFSLYSWHAVFTALDEKWNFDLLFFTEIFMEECGPAYYVFLNKNKNIIRFSGTVRDNAFVAKRMTWESDRKHFNSLAADLWNNIKHQDLTSDQSQELMDNFDDRYGCKWGLSVRNQRETTITPLHKMRNELGINEEDTVVIIYSHILYDTLFFNGELLFDNYADWLTQTVRNIKPAENVKWFLKIHPSNTWRGELEYFLGNKCEEIRVLEDALGAIPSVLEIIQPQTKYSPRAWLNLCDVGVTCTGTSGIELGILGKQVISAGTGRYENAKFAHHPSTQNEYFELLQNVNAIGAPTAQMTNFAKIFGFYNFCVKPTELCGVGARNLLTVKDVKTGSDVVFVFHQSLTQEGTSVAEFCEWILSNEATDFIPTKKSMTQ